MKIYEVEVVYRTVIRAESKEDAESKAEYIIRHEDDGAAESVYAMEITNINDLSYPWDGKCRPYGERDPMDRTLGEILPS